MTHPSSPDVTTVGDLKTSASDSTESFQSQAPRSRLSAAAADQLTVLVFKDNFTARTFRIPLKWVNQFGWLLALTLLAALCCVAVAIKLAVSRPGHLNHDYVNPDPQAQIRIHDLEVQLKEAQDRILSLSSTSAPQSSASPAVNAPSMETSDAPIIDPALLSPSSPISTKPFLFKALPDQIQSAPAEAPITMGAPSARWKGKTLAVRFNLQYVSKNPGGQQGRIIILARGPGMLLSHPTNIFQEVGKDFLINPNKGEFFSVSRYRETRADFGPVSSQDSIKEVEVLVLSPTGQILIHQKIIPGATSKASAPAKGSATSNDSDGAEE